MRIEKRHLPWLLAALFAAGFVFLLFHRREPSAPATVAPAPNGRRIVAWIDPMYSMGPPHLYKSDRPGIAPDCGMKLVPEYADDATATPAGTSTVAGHANVTLSPERQQLIGVKLAKVELRPLLVSRRTVGRVVVDETRLAQIHPRTEGFVERLFVNFTGESVRRGQPLLSFYSPDILATEQELLLARRDATSFNRTLADSARRRLLLWEMSDAEIASVERSGRPLRNVTLRSPVSGVVITRNAVNGAKVMPSDTLYELADLSSVWVVADVYAADLARVTRGSTVQLTFDALPGRSYAGQVSFVSPLLNPTTRTTTVRIELDNRDGALKPDMFANVLLDSASGAVLAVPDSAVMQTGTRSLVYVARGDGRFEPREVETGARANGFIEIRRGVVAGESVVAEANFLVDSESRLQSTLSGMGAAKPAGATP